MYGGSKLGRGGGRAIPPNKRNSFPPPPPPQHRLSTPSSANRLSLGSSASRNRTAGTSGATSSVGSKAVEETFSLVSGNNPLAFGMIIRLAPDLVEEIRKVESQGQMARIKFDSMANNPNGNVIDVGGKEFRFTWSRDGDLCDIYEEQQSGEDGDGLLVESGCAWRKVNVQRILDESTVNHVKMRSEEAERKLKQRKAIVLEHGNPSMKSQIKQLAAVEANPWKMQFKQKKEPPPFKKRKVETLQVSGPPKSTNKSGTPSTASLKSKRSASPLSSPPGQPGAPLSPNGTGNIAKNHMNIEEITPIQMKNKENASNSEKEIARNTSIVRETQGHKVNSGNQPTDLKNMLITLLMENPKGMSLKALEKAIGDTSPNSVRKIEPIIKKIATLQAPGRYFLKRGVELDSIKKPASESGSSPEDNHQQTSVPDNFHGQKPAPGPSLLDKVPTGGLGEQAQSNSKLGEESVAMEKADVQQFSPDFFGEKKVSDNCEGHPVSSSDSGSDSDSDSGSSDSGSDSGSHSRSRSRSRSRSPVGSGSGSSSDSETDASSNSKEASDEDVDIMTSDDDREYKQKLPTSEPGLSTSPIPWKSDDGRPTQKERDEKEDADGSDAVDIVGQGSDAIDIEKDLPDDGQEVEMDVNTSLIPSREVEKPVEATTSLIDDNELQERQYFIGTLFDDKEHIVKDSFKSERSDSPEKTLKNKFKRGPDLKHIDEISDRSKRSKADSSVRPPITGIWDSQFPDSPHNSSPTRSIEDPYKGPTAQMMNRADREGIADFGFQKGYNQEFSGRSGSDFQQSGQKSFDKSARSKPHDTVERPNKHDRKVSVKNSWGYDVFPPREKASRDSQNEDSFTKEKKGPRNLREGGPGSKNSVPLDSNNGKYGEMAGKFNETGQVGNGRSSILQRELSDLEVGELREPLDEEALFKKQFDRKGSIKQSENKSSTSDNCNSDLSKGKPVGKAPLDSGKTSPPNLSIGIKRTPENHIEDSTRTHHRPTQSQPQDLSRVDQAEVGSQFNKSMDASGKFRQSEAGMRLGGGLEGFGESHRKAPVSASQQHDSKQGLVSHSVKESKMHTSNSMADLVDVRKDTVLTESNNTDRRKRESSSDEDNCSYYKYEKDEPELKGPIKDISQYEEYLQEYQDKYESYISLNKILESYRKKFHKLGKDLKFAKDRDMERYYKLLGQLENSYHQCGPKHKRLKKIFLVLHEELKHLKQRMKDFAASFNKD
ncbi:dentin sialophosphoprotein-like [Mangifera indica]|uniref:dentin sialophosphoprotein-like n=1 Tax=Mangifera indica TaxID=29780 RepID=UPI001CFC3A7D|nr:dentin sialophosphoprotein-like [Mangifera indica]